MVWLYTFNIVWKTNSWFSDICRKEGKCFMRKHQQKKSEKHPINEDWLALVLAFLIILLASLGLLGQNGLNIAF